ncbi:5548_t:CDS:2 [Paraglomus occultum]|uniref:5548_t:CDS:1 n=1 Tax=Paraglomus occultum TaxID=144539 RepID=A0A9N9CGR0_9GLOM|nr:5548_t:CDS:2 [Paraglomus occultum]
MIDDTPVSMMAVEIHSTRLFGIESDASLGSLGLYCQTTWYRPKFYAEIETCLPTDLVCEVVLTDCTRFWEAKVIIYDLLNNTAGVSKDSKEKQLIVIHGLLSGQKIVDGRPCQIRANSHYELVFSVEGREGASKSKRDERMKAIVDIWKLHLYPVNDRPSSIMWRELMNNATKQINFVEEANAKFEEELKERDCRYAEMTNALARMSAQEREKELLSQFAVVLNEKKKKLRKLLKLLESRGISTEDITVPSSIVDEEMSEEPKTTKRKAAPKRNSTSAGRVKKTTAVKTTRAKRGRSAKSGHLSARQREKSPEIAYSLSLMSIEERQENISQESSLQVEPLPRQTFPETVIQPFNWSVPRDGSELADVMSATTIRSNESSFIAVGKESGSIPLSRDDVEMSLTTPSSDSAKVC